jgi:transposase
LRAKNFVLYHTFTHLQNRDAPAENLSAMAGMKWITRVPLSIKSARQKISDIEDKDWESAQIKGYEIAAITSEYANIKQRWIVVESDLRKQAVLKKIAQQVEKQLGKDSGLKDGNELRPSQVTRMGRNSITEKSHY